MFWSLQGGAVILPDNLAIYLLNWRDSGIPILIWKGHMGLSSAVQPRYDVTAVSASVLEADPENKQWLDDDKKCGPSSGFIGLHSFSIGQLIWKQAWGIFRSEYSENAQIAFQYLKFLFQNGCHMTSGCYFLSQVWCGAGSESEFAVMPWSFEALRKWDAPPFCSQFGIGTKGKHLIAWEQGQKWCQQLPYLYQCLQTN